MCSYLVRTKTRHVDFEQILLDTSLASLLVYAQNPVEYLQQDAQLAGIQHDLGLICASKHSSPDENDVDYFSQLATVKYLISKNETKKRIIVAFRGADNLTEMFDEFKIQPVSRTSQPASFKTRADLVPIGYFLDKLADGYHLVFTGHCLGAATAAMITIKLIIFVNDSPQYRDKIIFVGYGCPSVVDVYFHEHEQFDLVFEDRLFFLTQQNDIVAAMFDYLSVMVYKHHQQLDDYLGMIFNFLNVLLPNLTPSTFDQSKLSLLCGDYSAELVNQSTQVAVGNLTKFGTLIQIGVKNGLKELDQLTVDESKINNLFGDAGTLCKSIESHYVKNYVLRLHKILFADSNAIERPVCRFNDVYDSLSINVIRVDFTRNEHNTDVDVTLKMDSSLMDHLVAANLVVGECEFTAREKLDQIVNYLRFTCPNENLFNPSSHLKSSYVKLKLFAHFSPSPIEIDIDDSLIPIEIRSEFSQKYAEIQDMPFDLMYLHAAFYIQAVTRMENVEQANDTNRSLREAKNALLALFGQIDNIWNFHRDQAYDERETNEIRQLCESYLKYKIFDREQVDGNLLDMLRCLQFRQSDGATNLKELILDTTSNSEQLLVHLIPIIYEIKKRVCRVTSLSTHMLKTIHDRQNATSALVAKLMKTAVGGGAALTALAATGIVKAAGKAVSASAGTTITSESVGIVSDAASNAAGTAVTTAALVAGTGLALTATGLTDRKKTTAAVVAASIVAAGLATAGKEATDSAKQAAVTAAEEALKATKNLGTTTTVAVLTVAAVTVGATALSLAGLISPVDSLAYISGICGSQKAALDSAKSAAKAVETLTVDTITRAASIAKEGVNTTAVGAASAAVAAGITGLLGGLTAADLVYLKYVKFRYMNEKDDLMYKQILTLADGDRKFLGFQEKNFDDAFIDRWPEQKSDRDIFRLIQLNARMRDVLCGNLLLGVIGTKKTGKSTLVELLTDKCAHSSPTQPTTQATPYTLCDQVALIDYPHYNTSSLAQKLDFYFTRILLDYTILIFDAKHKGETNDERLLYQLSTRNNQKNVLVMYNQSDFLFQDGQTPDLQSFHLELAKNLNVKNRKKLLLTCLRENLDLRETDRMIRRQVFDRRDIKVHFFKILNQLIEKYEPEGQPSRISNLIRQLESRFERQLWEGKKILVIFNLDEFTKEETYILRRDKTYRRTNRYDRNFNNFEELIEQVKRSFEIDANVEIAFYMLDDNDDDKPAQTAKTTEKFKSIEDFFKNRFHCYKLAIIK